MTTKEMRKRKKKERKKEKKRREKARKKREKEAAKLKIKERERKKLLAENPEAAKDLDAKNAEERESIESGAKKDDDDLEPL